MLNDASSLPTGDALAPPAVNPAVGDGVESLLAKLLHVLGGGSGSEVVADTDARTDAVIGFVVLTDAVFAALTASDGYTATALTGVTFPAGTTLPFRLSGYTLTSGSVLAILA